MAVLVVGSLLSLGAGFSQQAAAAQDPVEISSATEYDDGTIEVVFNETTDAVDWVDVYVDGDNKSRIQRPGSGARVELDSPIGDISPNRNLSVVAQVDFNTNDDQVIDQPDANVTTTTINASTSAHRSLADAAGVFEGEPIALVSDGNTDVDVEISEQGSGSTVLDESTGTNSEVHVFETDSLTIGSAYGVDFGAPSSVTEYFEVSDLGLGFGLQTTQHFLGRPILVEGSTNRGGSDVTVDLRSNGVPVFTDVARMNSGGETRSRLFAPHTGTFDIRITDNLTGNTKIGGPISVTQLPGPAAVGEPVLNAALENDRVAPGETTTFAVSVMNNGSVDTGSLVNPLLTSRVTTARGLAVEVDPEEKAPITVHAGTYGLGFLPEGTARTLTVPVTIDESTQPGVYRVPINTSYRYTSEISAQGAETTENVTTDVNVSVVVERAPDFEIEAVDAALRADSTAPLRVTIRNAGRAGATDTRFTLGSPNPAIEFENSSTATRLISDWPRGETRTLAVEATVAADAPPHEYPLQLDAAYDYGTTGSRTETVGYFPVTPGSKQRFSLSNVSGTLAVGAERTLSGTVTNTGADPVANAAIRLEDDRPQFRPVEDEVPIGPLSANESATFEFSIYASEAAEPGPKQFNLTTRYRTEGDTVRRSPELFARTAVEPEPAAFAVEPVANEVPAGENGFFNVSVTNTGSGSYTDITARLFPTAPIASGNDERVVDELGPGESTTLRYPVTAGASAFERGYPVSLILRYQGPDGDPAVSHTFRRAMEVQTPTEPESGGPPLLLIGGALLVIVLAVVAYSRLGA